MKDTTKKVVILNNFSSPYVCEAIIILKDYNPQLENRAIADAERIVSEYLEKAQKNGQARKKPVQIKKSLILCLVASLITIAVLGCKLALN